jgi:hypothetical protein
MVGGLVINDKKVVDGGRVFGFGDGFDCPDEGRDINDLGYFAQLFKQRSVSSVSPNNFIVKADFFKDSIQNLISEDISIEMLGVWLAAVAMENKKRVIYSPFIQAFANKDSLMIFNYKEKSKLLSKFWHLIPDTRFYAKSLSLEKSKGYLREDLSFTKKHILDLQTKTLPYPEWFAMQLKSRPQKYPVIKNSISISLLTTIYEKTNLQFLEELAESIIAQTVKIYEWVIIAHGPISAENLNFINQQCRKKWGATLIIIENPQGIIGAMKIGLKAITGDYYMPVDADDLLTIDAIQIMSHSIQHSRVIIRNSVNVQYYQHVKKYLNVLLTIQIQLIMCGIPVLDMIKI